MPTGYPYAGILFLLMLYNVAAYFLLGFLGWRRRLEMLPYLLLSAGVLAALFLARVIWSVVFGGLPASFLAVAAVWLLGLLVVNGLIGGIAFGLIRGATIWLEGPASGRPEPEIEAPPSTWFPEDSAPPPDAGIESTSGRQEAGSSR